MYKKYADLRDELGYNDLRVAKETGIPQSTIYDWKQRFEKNEDARLSVDALAKVAKLLNKPIEYFIEG